MCSLNNSKIAIWNAEACKKLKRCKRIQHRKNNLQRVLLLGVARADFSRGQIMKPLELPTLVLALHEEIKRDHGAGGKEYIVEGLELVDGMLEVVRRLERSRLRERPRSVAQYKHLKTH